MKTVPILKAHNIERIFTVGKSNVNALMKVDFEIYQGEFINIQSLQKWFELGNKSTFNSEEEKITVSALPDLIIDLNPVFAAL